MIGFLLDFYCSKAFDLWKKGGRRKEMEGERSNVCRHDVARWQQKQKDRMNGKKSNESLPMVMMMVMVGGTMCVMCAKNRGNQGNNARGRERVKDNYSYKHSLNGHIENSNERKFGNCTHLTILFNFLFSSWVRFFVSHIKRFTSDGTSHKKESEHFLLLLSLLLCHCHCHPHSHSAEAYTYLACFIVPISTTNNSHSSNNQNRNTHSRWE